MTKALIEGMDYPHRRILYEYDGGRLLNEKGQEVTRCRDLCEAQRFVEDCLGYVIISVVKEEVRGV